ncbi:MAG TPA: hypothetical protein VFR02_01930, partial [bacterium]|nr:hypothetical protein [bacterium]
VSCGTVPIDPGAAGRQGLLGTQAAPAPLNPFKDYDLVMAGGEDRYFKMNLPAGWYWKLFVTAVDRSNDQKGTLTAALLPSVPPWQSLPLCRDQKQFNLKPKEGDQDVLGAANNGPDHPVVVELSQRGPPILVTLHSEISPLSGLLMRPLGWKRTLAPLGGTGTD